MRIEGKREKLEGWKRGTLEGRDLERSESRQISIRANARGERQPGGAGGANGERSKVGKTSCGKSTGCLLDRAGSAASYRKRATVPGCLTRPLLSKWFLIQSYDKRPGENLFELVHGRDSILAKPSSDRSGL